MAKARRKRKPKLRAGPVTQARAKPCRAPDIVPGIGPYPPEFIGPRITRDLRWTPTPEEIAQWKAEDEVRRGFDQMLRAQNGLATSSSGCSPQHRKSRWQAAWVGAGRSRCSRRSSQPQKSRW